MIQFLDWLAPPPAGRPASRAEQPGAVRSRRRSDRARRPPGRGSVAAIIGRNVRAASTEFFATEFLNAFSITVPLKSSGCRRTASCVQADRQLPFISAGVIEHAGNPGNGRRWRGKHGCESFARRPRRPRGLPHSLRSIPASRAGPPAGSFHAARADRMRPASHAERPGALRSRRRSDQARRSPRPLARSSASCSRDGLPPHSGLLAILVRRHPLDDQTE